MLGFLLLDEGVDDVVLQSVHDEGEDHHREGDLELLVAIGPGERPVTDLGDPGDHEEDDEDAELHAKESEEVDDGLLEPPPHIRGAAVVSGLDRLGRLTDAGVCSQAGDDAEQNDKNGNADSGLQHVSNCDFDAATGMFLSELTSMARFKR